MVPPSLDGAGRVYFGSESGFMYALHSGTGGLVWSFKREVADGGYTSVGPDGTIYFASDAPRFYAIQPVPEIPEN